ncbi:MAG: DnaJ C-terminal domain-containing protein [Candidatus Woesearchaeota archaeon]
MMWDFDYENLINLLVENLDECRIYEIPIGIRDVWFGTKKFLKISLKVPCPICEGKRYFLSVFECETCNGTGKVKKVIETEDLKIFKIETCPSCKGNGRKLIKCRCNQGFEETEKNFVINLPPGCEQNEHVLIRERDFLNEAIYGKIKIVDPIFEINDLDLILKITLEKTTILEKKKIEIKHPIRSIFLSTEELLRQNIIEIPEMGLINRKKEKGKLKIYVQRIEE